MRFLFIILASYVGLFIAEIIGNSPAADFLGSAALLSLVVWLISLIAKIGQTK